MSTAAQLNASAATTTGTRSRAAIEAMPAGRPAPASRMMSAHCAAKASSATVATERPTTMREIHVSCRQIRGTSTMGSTDLKPQPRT